MTNPGFPAAGECACGAVQYSLSDKPMIVHACHCSCCQRQTGSAFAVNALVETEKLSVITGELENIHTPSDSGDGQFIVRCVKCKIALWSYQRESGFFTCRHPAKSKPVPT